MHTIDDNFFSNIDSEHKAYFLGLMFADGNIHTNKTNNTSIRLTSINREILK